MHERAAQCYGADFAHMVRSCDRTCGFCDTCADADDGARCLERARAGECRSDLAHMAARCAKACGLCLYMYDAAPPHFVALWNGLLMPTIGFGTAGLGARTAGAVAAALRVGYRALDSAEAREWYREDLVAQARAVSLPATPLPHPLAPAGCAACPGTPPRCMKVPAQSRWPGQGAMSLAGDRCSFRCGPWRRLRDRRNVPV